MKEPDSRLRLCGPALPRKACLSAAWYRLCLERLDDMEHRIAKAHDLDAVFVPWRDICEAAGEALNRV